MKKGKIYILAALFVMLVLCGCQDKANPGAQSKNNQIVGNDSTSDLSDMQETEIDPAEFRLKLPEQYTLEYKILDEYGWNHDYIQKISKNEEGYYFDFGDSNEQYVFERIDSGKYIQYKYNSTLGKYQPTMLTPEIQRQIDNGVMTLDMIAIDENVVSGYAARITVNFDLYKSFQSHMEYEGGEEVNGLSCCKFHAVYEEVWGKQEAEVWIDPETGNATKALSIEADDVATVGKVALVQ